MRLTKLLKRQVSKVLCAALVLSTVAVAGERQVAEAASKAEIEANGTVLTLNETAMGVLETEEEQDWYIFEIVEQGYFSVDLKINDNADIDKIHSGWKYSLYYQNDLVNAISSIDSITSKYAGKELPLPKGRYYICVDASDHWGNYEPVDCPYDILINFTKTKEWEQEYNDTNAVPNSIDVNQIYFGNLHHSEDVDWYKVTTPEDGLIQIDFGPDVSTDVDAILDGWKVTILDGGINTMREYTYKTKWLPQILPVQQGTFYIRVEASDRASAWNSEPVNCIYNLQLKFTSTTDWETEYNGEYATANAIVSSNEYQGVLSWGDDEDWYWIDNEGDMTAKLQFRIDSSVSVDDIRDGWKIVVYNADREQITEMGDIKRTTIEEGIQLPKGASYIKICASDRASAWNSEPVDCIYHLTVTTIPVNTSGSDENSSSNPTETPDNTSNASNTDTPNSTSKPDSTSKPNNASKPNSTSTEIMEKAITTSKVTTSTVISKKKKSVYLRWKKQKYAGGYEIYRSTKKKKGFKKVKTIKGGSKVSWTDKKVKGGKTYYYKIRAYRKIKGKKAVSGFSKVKRVKVKK